MIEVVLDDVLASPGNEDELLDAGFARFLDGILDDGLVNDGEHFLGDRFGRRKEPCAHSGDRKHSFANWPCCCHGGVAEKRVPSSHIAGPTVHTGAAGALMLVDV